MFGKKVILRKMDIQLIIDYPLKNFCYISVTFFDVISPGHSWSLVVTRGHLWSLMVTRGHS